MSERTAALLKEHFPNDKVKHALANAVGLIAICYKIMTSRSIYDKTDKWRYSLRENWEEQKEKLIELRDFMINSIFADNYFQEGCIITINGILDLHLSLKANFDHPRLLTSHCDQDYVEAAFKDIRGDSR